MRSSTIVLAVGLLASPLAVLVSPAPQAAPSPFDGFDQASLIPAQQLERQGFTDAPVPGPLPGISPAERAAGSGTRSFDAGPVNSTPFSDTPTGTLSDGGTQVARGDRTLSSPDAGDGVTPNLGK